MKDDNKNGQFVVKCQTLYDVRLKKHVSEQVERIHTIDYNQLWIIFGLQYRNEDLDRAQLIMLASMLL